jgi:hypothetical protein
MKNTFAIFVCYQVASLRPLLLEPFATLALLTHLVSPHGQHNYVIIRNEVMSLGF